MEVCSLPETEVGCLSELEQLGVAIPYALRMKAFIKMISCENLSKATMRDFMAMRREVCLLITEWNQHLPTVDSLLFPVMALIVHLTIFKDYFPREGEMIDPKQMAVEALKASTEMIDLMWNMFKVEYISFKMCSNELHKLVYSGRVNLVEAALKEEKKEFCELCKLSLLHSAVFTTQESMVQCFLEFTSNIDSFGAYYLTPLMAAVVVGSRELVPILLKKRANIDIAGPHNFTALHMAVLRKDEDIVEILVDSGANRQLLDYHNRTAAMIAFAEGVPGIYICLTEKREKVEEENIEDPTVRSPKENIRNFLENFSEENLENSTLSSRNENTEDLSGRSP